jgi:Lar family restriction alleviation protein
MTSNNDKASQAFEEGELLPCPFCGGEAITNYKRFYGLKPIIRFGVSCQGDCGIFLDERAKSEAEAIAAWNRRTPSGVASVAQDRDGVLDEVVTAIEEIMNDYRGPIDIFYGKYQTTNSGEAILKVVLALKRQPKE